MVSAHARLWALFKIHSSGKFAHQGSAFFLKNPCTVGLRAQLRALFELVKAPACALGPAPLSHIFGFQKKKKKKGVATKGSVETVPQQACAEQAVASE